MALRSFATIRRCIFKLRGKCLGATGYASASPCWVIVVDSFTTRT